MRSYEYAIALTSQLPFCSVPLRLDAYNQCQFSCAFCFSKARGGNYEPERLQLANPLTLSARLERVLKGDIRGALDEFLQRRVPVQFGGMNDPFGPWESKLRVGLNLLRVLAEFNYPTLISTKSTMLREREYIAALKAGNFYVRQSITALKPKHLASVERGIPSIDDRLRTTRALSDAGIPVSIRLQPIFLGHENAALGLIPKIARAGAVHVSAEYLKWPVETRSSEFDRLTSAFPKMLDEYRALGAHRFGREHVLPSSLKFERMTQLKIAAEHCGLRFGYAETELLHLNPFSACCNASDLVLRDANFFDATILGIVKSQLHRKQLKFPKLLKQWLPRLSVFRHLNSRSRITGFEGTPRDRHIEFLRRKWNSHAWRGGPSSFLGVTDTDKMDGDGNRIYRFDGPVTNTDKLQQLELAQRL